MTIYSECKTLSLVALALVHIRSSLALDVRIFIRARDAHTKQSLNTLLKRLNVGNFEVVLQDVANEFNVNVWPLDLTFKDTTSYIIMETRVDALSISSLIPQGKVVTFQNPWEQSTTGREKLQRALYDLAPLNETLKNRIRFARAFGPEIASYVFVHTGGIIALDPRRILDYEADGTIRFMSSLTPSRNTSQCILQGSNRECSDNAFVVEAVKNFGIKKARNKSSATSCVCVLSCGHHALGENELDSFGIARPSWRIACPLCDCELWKGVTPFYQRYVPMDTAQSILIYIPSKVVVDAINFYIKKGNQQRIVAIHDLNHHHDIHGTYDIVLVGDDKEKVQRTWFDLAASVMSCVFAKHILLYSIG